MVGLLGNEASRPEGFDGPGSRGSASLPVTSSKVLGRGLMALVAILVLLVAAAFVSGADSGDEYVTLLRDDFDTEDPHWDWFLHGTPAGRTINLRDGILFLNITDKNTEDQITVAALDDCLGGRGDQWLYVGVEVRLRCSDDNKDIGGGARVWYLGDEFPQWGENSLGFDSHSPESDPPFEGLHTVVVVNGSRRMSEAVTGVDTHDWHTYTILWEQDNTTFLVDQEVIASTDIAPTVPMAIVILVENKRVGTQIGGNPLPAGYGNFEWVPINMAHNVSIQIDYVRVLVGAERFHEMDLEISGLFPRALQLIEDLGQRGEDTTQLEAMYAEAQDNWQKDHYFYNEAKEPLERIVGALEHFDQIAEMFTTCAKLIEEAKQEGVADRTIRMMEGYYAQAESKWQEYDTENTKTYLQKILDMPEPALLPILSILGLILLPALLGKHEELAN